MSTIIISVSYAWKEGAELHAVEAAHKKLAEFIGGNVSGCRIFRYGTDAENR